MLEFFLHGQAVALDVGGQLHDLINGRRGEKDGLARVGHEA